MKKKIEKQEQLNKMIDLVKNNKVEFVADRAFPSGWRSVDLTSNPNYLRLSNDSAYAEIPFFGRSYQHTPGDRGGIRFENVVSDKKIEVNEKKGRISIYFSVRGENDNYRCALEVSGSGSSNLNIYSNNLQSISYNGQVMEWKPEKKKHKK